MVLVVGESFLSLEPSWSKWMWPFDVSLWNSIFSNWIKSSLSLPPIWFYLRLQKKLVELVGLGLNRIKSHTGLFRRPRKFLSLSFRWMGLGQLKRKPKERETEYIRILYGNVECRRGGWMMMMSFSFYLFVLRRNIRHIHTHTTFTLSEQLVKTLLNSKRHKASFCFNRANCEKVRIDRSVYKDE